MIKNVIEYLKESAGSYPDKIAFADEDNKITFAELDNKARQLATLIQGVCSDDTRNQPIALYMPKSINCLICFLGIAYSGNFYTPLDTKSPIARIENIIAVLKPVIIITDNDNEVPFKTDANIITLGEAFETDPYKDDSQYGYHRITDIDPLYVLFTSGSTGIPKGVTISHRGVIDYTEWLIDTFEFDSDTVFGNQAPFYFDNSILDIYSTLRVGASLFILPEKLFMFPAKLLECMNSQHVNTIFWVPSALVGVANSGALEKIRLDDLRKVLFCGEVMPTKQLNVWRKAYPDALYANLYGPTEITDVCAYYIVDRDFSDTEPLPIGRACENMEIIVLDEDNKAVCGDNRGELCVRGIGLSMGYYGSWEKTDKAFVQNPLNKNFRDIIYRTGDVVHYNEYGELMYDCRKDFQIKHQGHRIELGEIDTAGFSSEGIDSCCTLYDSDNGKIVFYYVSEAGTCEKDVYKQLKTRVPGYMMPSKIIKLDEMPLNLNGKIDRVQLGNLMKNLDGSV